MSKKLPFYTEKTAPSLIVAAAKSGKLLSAHNQPPNKHHPNTHSHTLTRRFEFEATQKQGGRARGNWREKRDQFFCGVWSLRSHRLIANTTNEDDDVCLLWVFPTKRTKEDGGLGGKSRSSLKDENQPESVLLIIVKEEKLFILAFPTVGSFPPTHTQIHIL